MPITVSNFSSTFHPNSSFSVWHIRSRTIINTGSINHISVLHIIPYPTYGKSVKFVMPTSSMSSRFGKKSLHPPVRRTSQVEQWRDPPNSNTWRNGIGITSIPSSFSRKLIIGFSPSSTTILLELMEKTFIDNQREDWHITGCSLSVV